MPGDPAEGMERLVVDVPVGVKDKLKASAASQDLNMGQLVRRILINAIETDEESG